MLARTPKTKCEICGKEFINGNSLRAHKSVHSQKEFTCKICNEVIKGAARYKQHVGNHKNLITASLKGNFPCKVCGKVFENAQALWGIW